MATDVAVLVCRGCCCGTIEKHPGFDHGDQLEQLQALVARSASARLLVTDCLGPCERSNVMVVRSGAARRWFGDLTTAADTSALLDWLAGGAEAPVPPRLAARQFDPNAAGSVLAQPVALETEALADLVHGVLRDGEGGWFLGVEGAGAEFPPGWAPTEVTRRGTVIEAISAAGGLRINVAAPVAAFSVSVPDSGAVLALFLAVPRALLSAPLTGLTDCGPDREALHASDREARRYDLAIGQASASFSVRTADPFLHALLDAHRDASWVEVMAA
ncbi:MAG: hypothetical protein JWL70_2476, partial [Acidimicrobiia bacterium]|nr:hypothetical protein [Acidimicrobiia bacterium]